jgi:hypothetical protein
VLDHRSKARRRPVTVKGDAAERSPSHARAPLPEPVVVNGGAPAAGPDCELAGWKGKGAVAF